MKNLSIFQALGRKRLEQLDGLRGLCALAVLITHLIGGVFLARQNIGFYPSLFLRSIFSFGHISVLIFFVLSGFVIGYTTPSKFTYKEAKNYVIRRLIRLYPIYAFALLLTFALAETSYNMLDILAHLFFLQGWLVPVVKNNMPLWSLHYEFIFYLLFLVIWKFDIKISKAMFVCALAGILSAIFRFHPFEILGYFTIWLCGLWLAQNMTSLKLKSKPFISHRFLSSCILMAAFESQNLVKMAINKYGASSAVLPDLLLVVLVTSVVAALIVSDKIRWYNLTFITIFIIEIITIIYYAWQHTFYSLDELLLGYQSAAFLILVLPLSFLFFKIPMNILGNMTTIGSFSYALYVIHYPILIAVNRIVTLDQFNTTSFFWVANIVATVFSLLLAWFLECYLHVKIAKRLKNQLKLI